jgi:hypothetical protein
MNKGVMIIASQAVIVRAVSSFQDWSKMRYDGHCTLYKKSTVRGQKCEMHDERSVDDNF